MPVFSKHFAFYFPGTWKIEVFKQRKYTSKFPSMWTFFFFFWKWPVHVMEVDEIVSRCGDIHPLLSQISAHAELHCMTLLQNAPCKIAYVQLYRKLYQDTSAFSMRCTKTTSLTTKILNSLKQYQKPSAWLNITSKGRYSNRHNFFPDQALTGHYLCAIYFFNCWCSVRSWA